MKIILLCISFSWLLVGCLTLPTKPVCARDEFDAQGNPTRATCAYPYGNPDFIVDNSGNNQYTLDGHNWSLNQLIQFSLITPPETQSAYDQFFLNYCHQASGNCPVPSTVTPDIMVRDFESRLYLP